MEEWFEPGQRWQRFALAALLPFEGWIVSLWWSAQLHGAVPVALGIATFFFAVLSFPPLYRRWMAFGERANRVVVGGIFFVIYAVVVPLFFFVRFKAGFRSRSPQGRRSFWIQRRQPEDSVEAMLRMG